MVNTEQELSSINVTRNTTCAPNSSTISSNNAAEQNLTEKPFTHPSTSYFRIQNLQQTYNLCDKIHVVIQAMDQFKRNKTEGGDYFRAKMYTTGLLASGTTDGKIVDYNNGSYSAFFTLRWSGKIAINVMLINSREAIEAMNRVRNVKPTRFVYDGTFVAEKLKKVVRCHVELPSSKHTCDYTDKRTGEPWFCEKPSNMPCSAYSYHRGNTHLGGRETRAVFKPTESRLFRDNNAIENPCFVVVMNINLLCFRYGKKSTGVKKIYVNESNEQTLCIESSSECRRNNKFKVERKLAAGFYFKDKWYSNECTLKNITVQLALSSGCLKHKRLYFFGDSTIRQWYEYFVSKVENTTSQKYTAGATWYTGPLYANSTKNNMTFFFRIHAYPIRARTMRVDDIKYTANEIDDIIADQNTIIFVCLFAHFEATSLQVYSRRLKTIKNALLRLYQRSPKTIVFMKSANTRSYGGAVGAVNVGDWLAMQFDGEMRKMMADIPNLYIIDVWDMTNNHRVGDNIHPPQIIITEYIRIVLSLICT
ncbi:NXPE family member 3-like [Antedon mediterranea]|uniref:NXPE family member 3-like n=1 Tax=Antedon mediterranea TaxID=105859 RepID=UPI003AF9C44A